MPRDGRSYVHSAYKVVYKIYLKKIHQVLVEQVEKYEEFQVIRRKSHLAHVQDGKYLVQPNIIYIQNSVQNQRPWN